MNQCGSLIHKRHVFLVAVDAGHRIVTEFEHHDHLSSDYSHTMYLICDVLKISTYMKLHVPSVLQFGFC